MYTIKLTTTCTCTYYETEWHYFSVIDESYVYNVTCMHKKRSAAVDAAVFNFKGTVSESLVCASYLAI